ncbi:hypothetical protein QFZ73_001377 [Peribacillus sp. V2I11]|nr:hypothetical protein [Peribacillus sp. V2I11]
MGWLVTAPHCISTTYARYDKNIFNVQQEENMNREMQCGNALLPHYNSRPVYHYLLKKGARLHFKSGWLELSHKGAESNS